MILSPDITCVEFPEYSLAVYGMSYCAREIEKACLSDAFPMGRQAHEILIAHGGDQKHIPLKKEELLRLGYDYIALGHIHKPQELCPGIAFSGALEPIKMIPASTAISRENSRMKPAGQALFRLHQENIFTSRSRYMAVCRAMSFGRN